MAFASISLQGGIAYSVGVFGVYIYIGRCLVGAIACDGLEVGLQLLVH